MGLWNDDVKVEERLVAEISVVAVVPSSSPPHCKSKGPQMFMVLSVLVLIPVTRLRLREQEDEYVSLGRGSVMTFV